MTADIAEQDVWTVAFRLGCQDDTELLEEIGRRLASGWSLADTEYALRIISHGRSVAAR